jgi:hypothetical protein
LQEDDEDDDEDEVEESDDQVQTEPDQWQNVRENKRHDDGVDDDDDCGLKRPAGLKSHPNRTMKNKA